MQASMRSGLVPQRLRDMNLRLNSGQACVALDRCFARAVLLAQRRPINTENSSHVGNGHTLRTKHQLDQDLLRGVGGSAGVQQDVKGSRGGVPMDAEFVCQIT